MIQPDHCLFSPSNINFENMINNQFWTQVSSRSVYPGIQETANFFGLSAKFSSFTHFCRKLSPVKHFCREFLSFAHFCCKFLSFTHLCCKFSSFMHFCRDLRTFSAYFLAWKVDYVNFSAFRRYVGVKVSIVLITSSIIGVWIWFVWGNNCFVIFSLCCIQ